MDIRWSDIKEFIKDFLGYIIVIILLFFTVVYVISLQQVTGSSMEPNYHSRDVLVLNKFHYNIFNPKRFDVVAIEDHNAEPIVKRIIGLPGESVDYRNDMLYINNQEVEENFLKNSETLDFSIADLGYTTIPDDYYLVLGDNRNKSTDSRDKNVGLIPKKNFIGKVMFRVWKVEG